MQTKTAKLLAAMRAAIRAPGVDPYNTVRAQAQAFRKHESRRVSRSEWQANRQLAI
jgi:hypothetical protein